MISVQLHLFTWLLTAIWPSPGLHSKPRSPMNAFVNTFWETLCSHMTPLLTVLSVHNMNSCSKGVDKGGIFYRVFWCDFTLAHSYRAKAGNIIEIPSGINLKLKSRKTSFGHNIHYNLWILLKFCTEHGSNTAALCAKFQKYSPMKQGAMDKRAHVRFQFNPAPGNIGWLSAPRESISGEANCGGVRYWYPAQ